MRKKYIKPALEMTLAQMDLVVLAGSGPTDPDLGEDDDSGLARYRQDYDFGMSRSGANSKQKGGGWGSLW